MHHAAWCPTIRNGINKVADVHTLLFDVTLLLLYGA